MMFGPLAGVVGCLALLSSAHHAHALKVSHPESSTNPMRIWQTAPGTSYEQSFLIGNGRLGFSLPGGALAEAITLNEDSFWSGGKMDRVNQDAQTYLPEVQSLLVNGEIKKAEMLASLAYTGTPWSLRHYDWMGDLRFAMTGAAATGGNVTDYERWLDIETGTAGVYYVYKGVSYRREYVASFPDNVIAMRITADKPGAISFTSQFRRGNSLNRFQDYSENINSDTILSGSGSGGADAVLYVTGAKATASGGTVKAIGDTIVVEDADEATVYFAAWTSYRKQDLRAAVLQDLKSVTKKSYSSIYADHLKDYQKLASRVDISLGQSSSEQKAMTTADRMKKLHSAFDPELAALYFYFGRYLLIASGREGTLPANLQGIWNNNLDPVWGSKYTININTEMNYWPSLLTNMPELHHSLLEHIERMRQNGIETARKMYNASGAVCHHNTDMWGDTAPQDNYAPSTFWPTGLAWMATHIYEHFLFTGDIKVLRKYYPAIRDSAVFFLDFLSEHKGHLVTNPSVSPELEYRVPGSDEKSAITIGPTCDNSIIWELFGIALEAGSILGEKDKDLARRIRSVRSRLPPLRKNQHGGIAEWMEDYEEIEAGHRHFSQLFGLYPGSQITQANATTFEAARSSLRRRLENGGGDTGWSRAWAIAFEGRLFNGTGVSDSYEHLLLKLTNPYSLLDINPPSVFQLDGNYGGAATIVEAFVQSHELVSREGDGKVSAYVGDREFINVIRLLPALPKQWAANGGGHARGLLARGGFEVDVFWDEDGQLLNATLKSLNGNTAWITLGDSPIGAKKAPKIKIDGHGKGGFVKLRSKPGKSYNVKRVA